MTDITHVKVWLWGQQDLTPKQFLRQLLESQVSKVLSDRVTAVDLIKKLSRFFVIGVIVRMSENDDLVVRLMPCKNDDWDGYQIGYCYIEKPVDVKSARRSLEQAVKCIDVSGITGRYHSRSK